MKQKLILLFGACAFLMTTTGLTAPIPSARDRAPKSSATCFAGFPQGVFLGSPYTTTNAQLAFFLTSSYTLKDPSLAHEAMPGVVVAAMNSVSPSAQYAVADGSSGNFAIHLNVFQDATQDHYGITVIVYGPPKVNFRGYDPSQTQKDVQYFQFTLPAQYVTGSQLIQDAATKTAGYLEHGWSCN